MQPSLKRGRQQLQRGAESASSADSQALLQRLGSSKNINALYNQVIEATIERCTQFQSAKVMEAIERQWRLALQRRTAELRRAVPASSGAGSEASGNAGKGAAVTQGTSKTRTPPSASAAPALPSAALPPAALPSAAQSGMSPVPTREAKGPAASRGGALEGEKGRSGSDESANASVPCVAAGNKESLEDGAGSAEAAADDDDDFADADVDEAETVGGPTPGPYLGSGSDSQNDGAALAKSASQELGQQAKEAATTAGVAGGADANCHTRTELEEREEQLDDVSDLDDQEPTATDGIYALYEKVERCGSSGKKTTNWRVTLRHGIIRAGRQEIAFDRLYGELKF
uniref:Uncharacterized protein n=1 Tax=Neospora caninum (strain Liverpool) TaxID=572307 RepID=A0A0F7UFR8_NEOCL|nr:TPA: hypothetical protein BN1204_032200 [Neospora caninum Liverpool]